MSEDRLLTASEVAEILHVKLSWVREATREGRLPHIALGSYRRYQRTQILGFIDEQRRGPGAGYARR